MTPHPESPGGQGEEPSRSDLRLYARALRQDWAMEPKLRTALLRKALRMALGKRHRHDPRTQVAAMRVVLAAGGLSLRQQALDLRREELERKRAEDPAETVRDAALELAAEAAAYERDHPAPDQGRAGEVPA